MKVLTLRDPWATLVKIGAKTIETRSWSTGYRGPLAIHASKNFSAGDTSIAHDTPEINRALRSAGYGDLGELPRGAIIAICDLIDVAKTNRIIERTDHDLPGDEDAFGDFSPGRFGWFLQNIRPLDQPIPTRGSLGLWDFDLDAACVTACVREATSTKGFDDQ